MIFRRSVDISIHHISWLKAVSFDAGREISKRYLHEFYASEN